LLSKVLAAVDARDFPHSDTLSEFAKCLASRKEFAREREVALCNFLLKISTNEELLTYERFFDVPLAQVFDRHCEEICPANATADRLSRFLLTVPRESSKAHAELTRKMIVDCLRHAGPEDRTSLYGLVAELADGIGAQGEDGGLAAAVLEDMIWSPGKEKVAYRASATVAIGKLMPHLLILAPSEEPQGSEA
jgi:hypothetical protein